MNLLIFINSIGGLYNYYNNHIAIQNVRIFLLIIHFLFLQMNYNLCKIFYILM